MTDRSLPTEVERQRFAEGIADYMLTHKDYESLTKREVVIAAIRVLTGDIGAAQSFLNVIGVDYDLFSEDPEVTAADDHYCGDMDALLDQLLAERTLANKLAHALAITSRDINAPLVVEALDAYEASRPQPEHYGDSEVRSEQDT